MKKLDIQVAKSREAFHRNYRLHDLAQEIGERWLKRWGFGIVRFGEDARYQRLWEAGQDKPDAIVMRSGKPVALLDWKAKSSPQWWMNNRAFRAYLEWENRWHVPAFVAFALFDVERRKLVKFRFAVLARAMITVRRRKAWDRNTVVEFAEDSLKPFRRDHFTRALTAWSHNQP